MKHPTLKSRLKVKGKMTPQGADSAGLLQSIALIIFTISILILSLAWAIALVYDAVHN